MSLIPQAPYSEHWFFESESNEINGIHWARCVTTFAVRPWLRRVHLIHDDFISVRPLRMFCQTEMYQIGLSTNYGTCQQMLSAQCSVRSSAQGSAEPPCADVLSELPHKEVRNLLVRMFYQNFRTRKCGTSPSGCSVRNSAQGSAEPQRADVLSERNLSNRLVNKLRNVPTNVVCVPRSTPRSNQVDLRQIYNEPHMFTTTCFFIKLQNVQIFNNEPYTGSSLFRDLGLGRCVSSK